MRYAEAILICDNIAADSLGGREIDMDTKLSAEEKIYCGRRDDADHRGGNVPEGGK